MIPEPDDRPDDLSLDLRHDTAKTAHCQQQGQPAKRKKRGRSTQRETARAPETARRATLLVRRELQGERWWAQYGAGCSLLIDDVPGPLRVYNPEQPERYLCQLTRWSEDWTEDEQWFEGPWLRAWIGGHATQVRVADVIQEGETNGP